MRRQIMVAAAAGWLACGVQAQPKPPAYGVRGKVETVTPASSAQAGKDALGTLMVVGKKEADTEGDRAVVIVTRTTRILRGSKPARWEDLKKGQRVEARFKPGPRIMIYPTRAEATEVRILPAQ